MSLQVKQFLCLVIFKEENTHYKAFIYELNKQVKIVFSFPLPVNNKGEQDMKYMEDYIKRLPYGNNI